MKDRPLTNRAATSIPVPACSQTDPPSLNLEARPSSSSPTTTSGRDSKRLPHGHQMSQHGKLEPREDSDNPKQEKLLRQDEPEKQESCTSAPPFSAEMEVNGDTAVWWDHMQEQQDGCDDKDNGAAGERSPLSSSSSRSEQVDFLVSKNSSVTCDECWDLVTRAEATVATTSSVFLPELEDEVSVQLRLQKVLIGNIELTLGEGGTSLTQTVQLSPNKMIFKSQDSASGKFVERWQRSSSCQKQARKD